MAYQLLTTYLGFNQFILSFPIWTNYYVSYTSFFKPIKKAFKSRKFEFIGKNENR